MSDNDLAWDADPVRALIRLAVKEDIGTGDVTTEACVAKDQAMSGYFLAKQDLITAGTPLLKTVYEREKVTILIPEGSFAQDGHVLACVRGTARRLLTLERTALNLLQRTCGIATVTRQFVEALRGTGCTLLDTRKTAPGMRMIDKLAVAAGGGKNHRLGLFDAVLIKNNHIDAAGGVQEALQRCSHTGLPLEIEVRDFGELEQALEYGATHVLLDNFTPEAVASAVTRIGGRAMIEVSGNLRLDTVRAYAEAGADYVSVGALTHSTPAADISFRLGKP